MIYNSLHTLSASDVMGFQSAETEEKEQIVNVYNIYARVYGAQRWGIYNITIKTFLRQPFVQNSRMTYIPTV